MTYTDDDRLAAQRGQLTNPLPAQVPPQAGRVHLPEDDRPTELVSPWTVLMAVRYGLGRMTYAHGDAVSLIVRHWPVLRPYKASILADLQFVERTSSAGDIKQSCQDMIAWIELREIADREGQ